jgi:hypothetical protein
MNRREIMKASRVERCDIYISDKRIKIDPNKPVHPLNKRPLKNNFMFVPSHCPELRAHTKSVVWDCVNKMLIVEIYETKDFAAHKWFGTINKRKRESTNSPFIDIGKDAVALIFLDAEETEVARFKFLNLELIEHECSLGQVKWDITAMTFGESTPNEPDPLIHEIKIKYEEVNELKIVREDEPSNPNEIADQEWQDVKPDEI